MDQSLTASSRGKAASVTVQIQSSNAQGPNYSVTVHNLATLRRCANTAFDDGQGATLSTAMARSRVLENRKSGERFVIRQSAADTDGQLLEFDVLLQPGAHVPAAHAHPSQRETFTILDGRVRFRLGGDEVVVGPGECLVVPEGTSHWFGNAGDGVAAVRVEVRPALRMEELFETTVRCADQGAGLLSRCVRKLNWALILLDFRRELAVPNVPAWLITASLSPLAWLRRGLLYVVSGT